jgi:hypothetical protein
MIGIPKFSLWVVHDPTKRGGLKGVEKRRGHCWRAEETVKEDYTRFRMNRALRGMYRTSCKLSRLNQAPVAQLSFVVVTHGTAADVPAVEF